ncbi:MAG: class I SAM-dependent methyltransferase, partial [Planctomycetota bacterium]
MIEAKNQTSQLSEGNTGKRPSERLLPRWRRRNSYYYNWLDRIYRFVVRPNSRVLHVGCECGDLLAAVEPSYGVGVDADGELIELAKKRYGHLHFHTVDPHELSAERLTAELNEKFDYVLICNSLGKWHDIQQVLERIRPLTKESTRIIITYYNYLWEGILSLGSLLRIRRP